MTKQQENVRTSQPRVHPSAELRSCKLGRYVVVGQRVVLREVQVGDFTYFERNGEAIYATVGKFCSIAANVRINALEHPMERVTTHKITYRPNEFFKFHGIDQELRERRRAKHVTIGHDVWIGHGAVIMPGVSIGNGAVIGANAVVTSPVADYEIVAGVPARPIRMRFDPNTVAALKGMRWWDWSDEVLSEAIPDMQAMDIDEFIKKWDQ